MEKLFFELIQVSTGQLDCLSRGPEPEEWQELYEIAHQQQLVGVCYRGVQALFEYGLRVPQDLIIEWMSEAELIEQRNDLYTQRCIKVQTRLSDKSFMSSVLAGQGAARDYGEGLQTLRQPDSIDIFANGTLEELQEFAERIGQEVGPHDYRQLPLLAWDDTEVHLHYRIAIGKNPIRNRLLKTWFEKNRKALYVKDGEITRPSAAMNAVYMLVHLYWKFLYEGITLRDLMDCFYAMKRLAAKDRSVAINFEKVLKGFGLLDFSRGVVWAMQEAFGLEPEAQIVKPLASKGSFILHQVMTGRNFFSLALKYPAEMFFSLF